MIMMILACIHCFLSVQLKMKIGDVLEFIKGLNEYHHFPSCNAVLSQHSATQLLLKINVRAGK